MKDKSGDRPVPEVMAVSVAQGVRARVCANKRRMGLREARALAARCNMGQAVGSRPYNAYRCPFDRRHWHVAHLISAADMGLVARAIRALAQAA